MLIAEILTELTCEKGDHARPLPKISWIIPTRERDRGRAIRAENHRFSQRRSKRVKEQGKKPRLKDIG